MASKGNTAEGIINLKLNGEDVGKTLTEMRGNLSQMYREVNKLETGSEAWISKMNEIGRVEGSLKRIREAQTDIKKQYVDTSALAEKANKDMLAITPLGGILSNISQGWNTMQGFVQGNVGKLGALKSAIAATGIGALILLLTGLFSWFTKTDEGAKKLEGAMNGLKLVANLLMKPIQDIGKFLVSAFENPKQAMKDLGDFLLNNLINRFKAFAVILDGILNLDFKKAADGAIQLASGVENATDKMSNLVEGAKKLAGEINNAVDAGFALADLIDNIDEKESNLIVTNARAQEQIGQLLLQAKDRTKSEADRLSLLDRASKLETSRLNDSIALSEMKVKAAQLEYDQAAKTENQTDEQYRKLKQAEADLINLRSSSIDLQEKITNRRNALIDSELAQKQKSVEAQNKITEEAEKNELEIYRKITDLKIQNIKDEEERKKVIILNNYKRALEDAFANGQLTKELEKELLIQRDNELTALELEIKTKNEEKAKADKEVKNQEKLAILEFEKEQLISEVEFSTLTAQQKEDAIYEIELSAAQQRLTLLQTSGTAKELEIRKQQAAINKLENDHQVKSVELTKRTNKQKADLDIQMLSQTAGVFGGVADLLEQDEVARKKYGGVIQGLKIAEITLSGVTEVASIWQHANANPLNAVIPGWGAVFAGIQTALAVARTAYGIGKVTSTKFSQGGMLTTKGGLATQGQSHENHGIQLFDGATGTHLGEMERGEHIMILSKAAYANNSSTIDALLQSSLYNSGAPIMRNGGFFEDGGLVNIPMEAGAERPAAEQNNLMALKQLEYLKMVADNTANWPKVIQAVVVYEQMKAIMDEAQEIENNANAA